MTLLDSRNETKAEFTIAATFILVSIPAQIYSLTPLILGDSADISQHHMKFEDEDM